MKKSFFLAFALFCISIVSPVSAIAQIGGYTTLCFRYDVNYLDADVGDYWVANGIDRYARGIWAEVWDRSTSPDTKIWEGYTNSTTGCTSSVYVMSNKTYNIRLLSKARVTNNNDIIMYNNSTSNQLLSAYVASDVSLLPSHTYTYTWVNILPYFAVDYLAAVTQSLYRQPAGQSGWDFRLYNEECFPGDYDSSCFTTRTGHPAIFLGLLHRNYKVPVSHEMGHFVAYLENGATAEKDYTYVTSDPDCEDDPGLSHGRRTQEWQNAAAWEGFANFYSATVWNNTGQDDCEFNNNFDCAIDEKHLETKCDLPIACTGTDGDWMQFWWNVMRDEGLSVAQVNNIYDEADPQNWSDPCSVYMDLGLAASSLDYMRILYWLIYGDDYGINH